MRLIGAVLIFAAIAWCGMRASLALKQRREFLEGFITALELLKSEIAFSVSDLKSAFENVAGISGARIFMLLAEYVEGEGINSACEKAVEISRLTGEEAQLISLLASKLGKTDVQGQLRHIEYVAGIANELRKKALQNYEKSGVLYRRGAILIGIFAVLLLI